MNRTCQQRRDRQHGEVVPALGGLRQGVGGDNFLSTALRQTLACGVREDAVGTRDNDGTCASFTQYADRASDGSAGINHVIEQDAVLALNITDHAVGHGLVRFGVGARLVDECQWGIAKLVCPLFCNLDAACIRGDHNDVVNGVLGLDVLGQNRHGVHVIDRAVEETLDLVGVQVHRHDAVSTCGSQQVSHQASGNRLATEVLLVLASIWVERQDSRDALSGTTLERINHDELLHEPLVQRLGVGLQNKAICTTNGLFEANEDFAIRKVSGGGRNQVSA